MCLFYISWRLHLAHLGGDNFKIQMPLETRENYLLVLTFEIKFDIKDCFFHILLVTCTTTKKPVTNENVFG